MAKLHRVTVDGRTFHARSGQNLLEAALINGVDLPHDCRAGQCGSCLARVRSGITLGGATQSPGMVHACQAMVLSDLDLEIEPLPAVSTAKGKVEQIVQIGEDILEVRIASRSALGILPGQYCRVTFRGFPARCFSPTVPLDGVPPESAGEIRLHIKKVRGGCVTPHIGEGIRAGHAVSIEGPLGSAFLRPGLGNRLVLVGSGTGFAPVWAIATAALAESPSRPITLLASSRSRGGFYMRPALAAIVQHHSVGLLPCIEEARDRSRGYLPGSPLAWLPEMTSDDIVYAAGAPRIVEAVGESAAAAGATFYADPFLPQGQPRASSPGLMDRARAWLLAG